MESKPGDPEGIAATTGKAVETGVEETNPTSKPKDPAPATTDEVPDPDEDDLDDLDDMLDEFTPSKPEPKAPSISSGPGRPEGTTSTFEGISDDDFAAQLQSGMAELLGELETSPDMQAQFESILKEIGGASTAANIAEPGVSPQKGTPKTASATAASTSAEETFQATIKKTMERMQASGESATAAVGAAADSPDDLLAEMMKAMQASGLDGEGGEEDFSKMLLGMMEQLTNKEILYEPMKELDDKFPEWMEKNGAKQTEEDLKRYKEQQIYVREIVGRFEAKGYSDDNAKDREYIVERMQKMQAAGSPPPDLVGDMAAAQEAFGAPEEGCPQQ